jgi:hypothetical protein
MARSVVYVVSDDPMAVQRARNWANENGYSFQAFNSGQWNNGLENGQFRNQLKSGHVSLTTGSTGGQLVSFPGGGAGGAKQKVMSMNDMESMAIQSAIQEYKGNLTEAAKALGIGRATLYRKVKQYNIDPSTSRSRTPKAA